ncbi:MAG: kelch repeat-containing protein [Planctomycetota bacterium]
MRAFSLLSLVAVLGLTTSLRLQTQVQAGPPFSSFLAGPVLGAPVPLPPRAKPASTAPQAPNHKRVVIPPAVGQSLPLPTSPPTTLGRLLDAPGDFALWYSRGALPAGSLSTWPPEPQALVEHDMVLSTHNSSAALSSDSGVTWSLLAPPNRFPNSDGGFSGDQRLVRTHTNPQLDLWILQYNYSPVTMTGRHRIAVARGRDALRDETLGLQRFYTYDFSPTDFGFPAGLWMDFPDLACSNSFLYGTSAIFRDANTGVGFVWWRIPLADLAAGGVISYEWYTDVALGASLVRLTQNAADTMYGAARRSANTLRLFWWPDGGQLSFSDHTTAITSTVAASAPGPDLRNWAGFTDHRITGAYMAGTEAGFAYSSAPVPGRPRPFVRVSVFDTTTRTLTHEEDIWSNDVAFLYPAVSKNAFNHKAVVMAAGGPSLFPSTVVVLNDPDEPGFGGGTYQFLSQGTSGPNIDRWGDYNGVTYHPLHPATFVAPAFSLQGGPTPASLDCRFTWFGRERYTPVWVDVDVTATAGGQPIPVPMTITQSDRRVLSNGVTPFQRSYPPRQALTVFAPSSTGVAGISHRFVQWIVAGQPQPMWQTRLDLGDIGAAPFSIQARYEPIYSLRVDSVPAGVTVFVDTNDFLGRNSGTTPFERFYPVGTRVTLIAPASSGSRFLTRWLLDDSAQAPSQRTLIVEMTGDRRATADYSGLIGNGVDWTPLTGRSPTWPSPRRDHAMVFDRNNSNVVLFGGESTLAALRNDTWLLTGDQWTQASPANSPSPRFGPAAAYHASLGLTVLFGGAQYLGVRFDDTWTWDGADWTLLNPPVRPPARFSAAATYDWLSNRVLLFGGVGTNTTRLNDMWAFDGTTWTELTPPRLPPALERPTMCYDATTGHVLLTGRDVSSTSYQKWEFDQVTWRPLPVNSVISARSSTPIVQDPHRNRIVSFGGMVSGTSVAIGGTNEWEDSYVNERLTELTPAARGRHGFVWDEWRARFVMFGGQSASGTLLDDTWEYTFDCDAIAPGSPGGGIDLRCTSRPRLGNNFCIEFDSPTATGLVMIGLSGLQIPATALGAPLFCTQSFLNVTPDVVEAASGSPASFCIAIPNDPALAYAILAVQGVPLHSTGCLFLTKGAVVALRP